MYKQIRQLCVIGIALAAVGLLTAPANAAIISVGTKIGVDFGPTPPTNFFNNVTTGSGTIAAGDLIDTSNVVVDGVSFSWSGTGGAFLNNDASHTLGGQPDVFNDSNKTDWLGFSGGSTANTITLTFAGLDDAFTYDLIIGAAFTGSNNAHTRWESGAQSATTVSNVVGQSYVTLARLTTDGLGNLVITGTGTNPRPDIPVVAALHLTAVPEPGTWLLLLSALACGLLVRRRR